MKLSYIPLIFIAACLISCKENENAKTVDVINETPKQGEDKAETAIRKEIAAYAKEYLGTSYCYAGNSPERGFDCSGFVNFVFKNFNIELPRSSSGFTNLGTPLKPEEFRVGDILVFYGYRDTDSVGHVGIICEANGMQSKFIHSSSGSEMAVIISDLGSDMYTKRFYKCINPFEL